MSNSRKGSARLRRVALTSAIAVIAALSIAATASAGRLDVYNQGSTLTVSAVNDTTSANNQIAVSLTSNGLFRVHDPTATIYVGSGCTNDFSTGDAICGASYVTTVSIISGGGNDTVNLQALGSSKDSTVLLGSGEDWFYGTDAYDNVVGGDGISHLHGNGGNDYLRGGWQNDELYGNLGDDTLEGSRGDDTIHGSWGSDTATYYQGSSAGVTVDLAIQNGSSQDTVNAGWDKLIEIEGLRGTEFDDWLYGNNSGNTLDGGGGADHVYGNNGTDFIYGGEGNDWLLAGYDTDYVTGQGGQDVIAGEGGNDFLWADDDLQDAILCGSEYDKVQRDSIDQHQDCEEHILN